MSLPAAQLAPIPTTYQDRVERVFIVNATHVFSIFLSLCSQVFTQEFLSKVAVYTSSDKERLVKDLLEMINAEDLPEEFGGCGSRPASGGSGSAPASSLGALPLASYASPRC